MMHRADQPGPVTIELTLLSAVSHRGREITAPRVRGLLALLAGELRAGCGTARLVEGLWPQERPDHPAKALQILVSRARRQLGPDVIASTPTGYRLALREDQVDTAAVRPFAAAAAEKSRAGDHAGALAEAEEGLALWDGAPAVEEPAPGDPVAELRAERAGTHRALARCRALALARTGRREEAATRRAVKARVRGPRRLLCSSPSKRARWPERYRAYSGGRPSAPWASNSAWGSGMSEPETVDRSRTRRGSVSAAFTSSCRVTRRKGVLRPGRTTWPRPGRERRPA